ncbi:MAG TPA: MarR family winged helix-turn-helix transcriptional regulator [Sphingobium sp.]|nr:MarR family winged helix-turn-helix transcriptional regulator [Sphingobium sp.]
MVEPIKAHQLSTPDPSEDPEQGYQLDQFLPYLVVKLSDSWVTRFRQELHKHGISMSRWRVLQVVCWHSGISVNEVCRHSAIYQTSASRIIDQFVSEGLMTREVSDKDGRAVVVQATEEGRALFRKIWPLVLDMHKREVASLTAREEQTLVKLIGKMLENGPGGT